MGRKAPFLYRRWDSPRLGMGKKNKFSGYCCICNQTEITSKIAQGRLLIHLRNLQWGARPHFRTEGGTRTHTSLLTLDFESSASTSSATSAINFSNTKLTWLYPRWKSSAPVLTAASVSINSTTSVSQEMFSHSTFLVNPSDLQLDFFGQPFGAKLTLSNRPHQGASYFKKLG